MIKEKTKKILVFLIIISFIFFNFSLTLANSEDAPPENNPLCWKKEACERKRIEIFGERIANQNKGWIQEGVCTGEWGKCLATIEVNLKIPIGENRVISNIANYLAVIYDYSLKVIAILAVVVLIISGMQWITSAGRGEVVKKAQKRITGVIIGLGLAYFSFIILDSINPSLTALNAPNIWMFAPVELADRGEENALCTTDADCAEGYECVSFGSIKSCSSGHFGGPCSQNEDCGRGLICGGFRCIYYKKPIGDICQFTDECEDDNICIAIRDCEIPIVRIPSLNECPTCVIINTINGFYRIGGVCTERTFLVRQPVQVRPFVEETLYRTHSHVPGKITADNEIYPCENNKFAFPSR